MIRGLSVSILNERFLTGAQERLIITSVPAGADPLLVGKELAGQTLTVTGNYTFAIQLGGIQNKVEVHLTANNVSGTMPTSSGGTTFQDQTTQKTAFTGIGLLVTATRQTLSLVTAALDGSKIAVLTLNLPAASSCTFTQAEVNGK
jgi:hypothetical protein